SGLLFQVPAFAILLCLLGQPATWLERILWAVATALVLPLTGLGSAACQEVLLSVAEERQASAGACLLAALRRAPEHVAARAMLLVGVVVGLFLMIFPGLGIWIALATVHTNIAAGRAGAWAGLGQAGREAARDSGKTGLVVLIRVPLLLMAVINLHLLGQALLWVAANLVGLDVTPWNTQVSLGNPIYLAALVLLCWMLLTPWFEAANFLLFLHRRTRRQGLALLLPVH